MAPKKNPKSTPRKADKKTPEKAPAWRTKTPLGAAALFKILSKNKKYHAMTERELEAALQTPLVVGALFGVRRQLGVKAPNEVRSIKASRSRRAILSRAKKDVVTVPSPEKLRELLDKPQRRQLSRDAKDLQSFLQKLDKKLVSLERDGQEVVVRYEVEERFRL